MTEHTFTLENISPLEVYGVNNLRLHQIEEGYPGVKIVARGDELKIQGETEKIQKLKDILTAILGEIKQKGKISENRFSEMLQPEPRGYNTVPEASPDTILVHGSGGSVVKPKNAGQRKIVAAVEAKDVVFAVGRQVRQVR